jgi:membrane-bound serine protease (ClpP class)
VATPTRRLPLLLLLPALLLALAAAARARGQESKAPAKAGAGGTVVVPIQGPLSEKMLALTIRSIRRAHELGASALVFEIDTEGGEVGLMDRLIDEIERAEDVQTIGFVTQKAASAGAAIAISCHRLYMKPGSNLGSALVLVMPGPFSHMLPEVVGGNDPDLSKKILSHYQAHFRAKAQANGRPGAIAEAMVFASSDVYEVEIAGVRKFVSEKDDLPAEIDRHGEAAIRKVRTICRKGDVLNLTAQEALDTRLIDGMATSRADLLQQIGLAGAPVTEITPSWSEHLVDFTERFGVLLLIAGLVAVFIEVKVPGFGLPGILGTLLLGLYLFGKYLVGLAEITEILLIVAGFALIAVEIFALPGTMVPGILGVVALLSGLVLASQQTFLPESGRPLAEAEWWSNVRSLSLGLAAGVAGMVAVAHFFPSIPFLNRAVLRSGSGATADAMLRRDAMRPLDVVDAAYRPEPGARGVARTVLRPAGKVEIAGRALDAVSEGSLVEQGSRVVVVRVEAAHVVVRPDESAG